MGLNAYATTYRILGVDEANVLFARASSFLSLAADETPVSCLVLCIGALGFWFIMLLLLVSFC